MFRFTPNFLWQHEPLAPVSGILTWNSHLNGKCTIIACKVITPHSYKNDTVQGAHMTNYSLPIVHVGCVHVVYSVR